MSPLIRFFMACYYGFRREFYTLVLDNVRIYGLTLSSARTLCVRVMS